MSVHFMFYAVVLLSLNVVLFFNLHVYVMLVNGNNFPLDSKIVAQFPISFSCCWEYIITMTHFSFIMH